MGLLAQIEWGPHQFHEHMPFSLPSKGPLPSVMDCRSSGKFTFCKLWLNSWPKVNDRRLVGKVTCDHGSTRFGVFIISKFKQIKIWIRIALKQQRILTKMYCVWLWRHHLGLNHCDWGWWSINQSCFIEILEAWYERLHNNKNTQKQVIVCEARHLCIPLHFRSWPVSRAMFWHLPSNSTTHWNLVVPSPWHELTKWLLPLVWGTNIKITISFHMSLQKELSSKNLISWSKSVFQLPKNRLITKTESKSVVKAFCRLWLKNLPKVMDCTCEAPQRWASEAMIKSTHRTIATIGDVMDEKMNPKMSQNDISWPLGVLLEQSITIAFIHS